MTRPASAVDLEAKVPEALRKYLDDPNVRAGFDHRAELIALGNSIRSLRLKARLTQEQLAGLIGSTQPEIVRLEKGLGKNGPTYHTLAKVGAALDQRVSIRFEPLKPGEHVEIESEGLEASFPRRPGRLASG